MTKETNPEPLRACYCGSTDWITVHKTHYYVCKNCGFGATLEHLQNRPLTMGEMLRGLAEKYPELSLSWKWNEWVVSDDLCSKDIIEPKATPEAAVKAAWEEIEAEKQNRSRAVKEILHGIHKRTD